MANSNYPALRTLVEKYGGDGFNLIAFPCNQFGGQAPGSDDEERQAAFTKFGFEFDVFDKIEVNGPGTHPLYKFLKQQQPVDTPGKSLFSADVFIPGGSGEEVGAITWNYTKFLVDRKGQAIRRYKPTFVDFEADVRKALGV